MDSSGHRESSQEVREHPDFTATKRYLRSVLREHGHDGLQLMFEHLKLPDTRIKVIDET